MTEEIFIINKACAEQLFNKDFKDQDEWVLIVGAAGRELLAQMRFDGMLEDIKSVAKNYKLEVSESYGSLNSEEAEAVIFNGKDSDYYWKRGGKEHALDWFFISTADRLDFFKEKISEAAKKYGFENVSVYVQPQHQGVCSQFEFVIPYDEKDKQSAEALFKEVSLLIKENKGYYARPFNPLWMDIAMDKNSREYQAMLSVKEIFDPEHIMNPGRIYR